jgi:hypothetical protein
MQFQLENSLKIQVINFQSRDELTMKQISKIPTLSYQDTPEFDKLAYYKENENELSVTIWSEDVPPEYTTEKNTQLDLWRD